MYTIIVLLWGLSFTSLYSHLSICNDRYFKQWVVKQWNFIALLFNVTQDTLRYQYYISPICVRDLKFNNLLVYTANHWCSAQCLSFLKACNLGVTELYHGADMLWVTLRHVAGVWILRTDLRWEFKWLTMEGGWLWIVEGMSFQNWDLSMLCRFLVVWNTG